MKQALSLGLRSFALSVVLTLSLAAACGGSTAAPAKTRAQVTGTIEGQPFGAHDSAAIVVSGTGKQSVQLLVTNLDDSCGSNSDSFKNKHVLSAGITSSSGALLAKSYGVYDSASHTIPSGDYVIVEYHATNATCQAATPPNTLGASGRVTLTAANLGADGGLAGDFDIILQNGDRLKGTFESPLCAAPDAGPADAGCR